MRSTWAAILGFMVMIVLLTGGGFVAGKHVFSHWEKVLGDCSVADELAVDSNASGLSYTDYKKIRLAFSAFDLAAGLTKSDFENIPSLNTYYFATLWMCVGAIFVLKKPRK